MQANDCWGSNAFENLAAHDLSYQISTESPDIEELFATISNNINDVIACRKVVALGEFLNAARGHTTLEGSPLLDRWLGEHQEFAPKAEFVQDVRIRLEQICKSSALKTFWEKKRKLNPWLADSQKCIARLQKKETRRKRGKRLSKAQLRSLAGKKWPGREGGGYDSNSRAGTLILGLTDPQTAVAMTRSDDVNELTILLDGNHDDERMLIPLKLLLRGWWNRLERLEVDVGDKETTSALLTGCMWELSNLPVLKRFIATCFIVNDEMVDALTSHQTLVGFDLTRAVDVTNRSIDLLGRCNGLDGVSLSRCPKITAGKVKAFEKKHPRVWVHFFNG